MKKTIKTIVLLSMVAVMILTLCACGKRLKLSDIVTATGGNATVAVTDQEGNTTEIKNGEDLENFFVEMIGDSEEIAEKKKEKQEIKEEQEKETESEDEETKTEGHIIVSDGQERIVRNLHDLRKYLDEDIETYIENGVDKCEFTVDGVTYVGTLTITDEARKIMENMNPEDENYETNKNYVDDNVFIKDVHMIVAKELNDALDSYVGQTPKEMFKDDFHACGSDGKAVVMKKNDFVVCVYLKDFDGLYNYKRQHPDYTYDDVEEYIKDMTIESVERW